MRQVALEGTGALDDQRQIRTPFQGDEVSGVGQGCLSVALHHPHAGLGLAKPAAVWQRFVGQQGKNELGEDQSKSVSSQRRAA